MYIRQDYINEIDKYIRHVAKNSDVVAVYSYGSISAPGFSDIDLIVVTKNKVSNSNDLSARNNGFNKDMFIHDVFVVPDSLFSHIRSLNYFYKIKALWSRDGFPSADIIDSIREVGISIMLDNIEMKLSRYDGMKYMCGSDLTTMHALKHSVFLAETLFPEINFNKEKVVVGDIVKIRRMISENKEISKSILNQAKVDTFEGYISILRKVQRSSDFLNLFTKIEKFTLFPNKIVKRCRDDYYYESSRVGKRLIRRYTCLPDILFFHFVCFYSPYNIKAKTEFQRSYLNSQIKRKKVIDAHYCFLKENKIYFSEKSYSGISVFFNNSSIIRNIINRLNFILVKLL